MNVRFLRCVLPISLLAVAACAAAPSEDGDDQEGLADDTSQAVVCDDVKGTIVDRSMAITDPAVLAKFTFARTLDAIRKTGNTATQTNTAIFQTWMKTFGTVAQGGTCDAASVDPNNYNTAPDFCPRTSELNLSKIDPFKVDGTTTFVPVGLFNRFDLAPSNGKTCGEYRIVYAMKGGSGRAFIIFEAAMPNPHPDQGISACLPLAQFWQSLSAIASPATRAAKLDKLYYAGGAVPDFEPVVTAAHYGLATNTAAVGAGQIRTNTLQSRWLLREFKTHRECTNVNDPKTCKLSMKHVTVKNNPANELFTGTHAKSAAFRTSFVNSVAALSRTTPATIAMSTSDVFNEFESVSQPSNFPDDVSYANLANADMKKAIQAKLTELESTLTVNNILVRAETQTCAGCHRLSAGASLGGKAGTWPSDGGFVQIDESGRLSQALTTSFLPRRIQVLEKFINDRCTPAAKAAAAKAPADDELTIGGSALDAPN